MATMGVVVASCVSDVNVSSDSEGVSYICDPNSAVLLCLSLLSPLGRRSLSALRQYPTLFRWWSSDLLQNRSY